MTAPERYQIYRWVCDCGRTQQPQATGWHTAAHIFVARPVHCRYAVVVKTDGTVLGMDLTDAAFDVSPAALRMSDTVTCRTTVYPNVDTAVAALSLQYDTAPLLHMQQRGAHHHTHKGVCACRSPRNA